MSSYFSFVMELCFLFCLVCVCVWYAYVVLIKLLRAGSGNFWLELAMGMYLMYLGKTPNTSVLTSLSKEHRIVK